MSYNDIRATEPPYPTPVNQDDYDALAARLAEAEQMRAHELAYVIETCAAMVKLGWGDARVEIRDLKAWATSRAAVRPADSASVQEDVSP